MRKMGKFHCSEGVFLSNRGVFGGFHFLQQEVLGTCFVKKHLCCELGKTSGAGAIAVCTPGSPKVAGAIQTHLFSFQMPVFFGEVRVEEHGKTHGTQWFSERKRVTRLQGPG